MALSLAINDLDAGYGAVKALRGVSLHVEAGETVALLGTNGNGKSTLMKCIAGLVRPQRGSLSLTIDGNAHDLSRLSPETIVDLGVALVPEGRRLFPKLTVLENLMLGAFRRAARRDIDRNLALAFETFPALEGRQNQLAGTMSGGQQQMLAIARALMSSPRLLLIDEPSVGLSPLLVSQTIAKIGELNQHLGLTVLMAEQNFNQAIRIANRGYIIVHGEIVVAAGSVDELRGNDIVKRLYLGGIREMFPQADIFMSMVQNSYAPVYRHRSFEFGEARVAGDTVAQRVHIVDANGEAWEALYTPEREADGSLKIIGCVLLKTGQAV